MTRTEDIWVTLDIRILQLAARTSECEVETVLELLLDGGTLRDSAQVKAVVQPERIAVPACVLTPPDLTVYDACLATAGGVQ
jgi:hypothetical protein